MKKYKYLTITLFVNVACATVSDGPYWGLEAGVVNQNLDYDGQSFGISQPGNNLSSSNYGFLTRFNFGYNTDKYNGFELGLNYNLNDGHNLPNNAGTLNTNAWTLDASYLLYLPTTIQHLSVFGRIGAAYDWINGQSNTPSIPSVSGNGFTDVIGAGIKYNWLPNLSIRAEWIANGLFWPVSINNPQNTAIWSTNTVMLGFNYHF